MIQVSWGNPETFTPKPQGVIPRMRAVVERVALEHDIPVERLRQPGRGLTEIATARLEAYYRCHMAGASYKEIARYFSDRNPATIFQGVQKHKQRMAKFSATPISTLST